MLEAPARFTIRSFVPTSKDASKGMQSILHDMPWACMRSVMHSNKYPRASSLNARGTLHYVMRRVDQAGSGPYLAEEHPRQKRKPISKIGMASRHSLGKEAFKV